MFVGLLGYGSLRSLIHNPPIAHPTNPARHRCTLNPIHQSHPLPHPRRLGNGAYGVVVAAKDTATGRAVAIKKCFNIFQSLSDAKKIAREVNKWVDIFDEERGREGKWFWGEDC